MPAPSRPSNPRLTKFRFIISGLLPEGVSLSEMKAYILTEVRANVGSRRPSDPLFNLNKNSIKVTRIKPQAEISEP